MQPSRAAASLLRQQQQHALRLQGAGLRRIQPPSPSLSLSLSRSQLGQQRFASIFSRKTPTQRLKGRLWTFTGVVLGGLFCVYAYDSSAGVHRWLVVPLVHAFTKDDPEASHRFAIKVLSSGLAPVDLKADQEDVLGFELWGRRFSNPVGLAAGFDKHGEAIDGLFNLGFSYVEIGSITPEAQPGNPTPRLFRLPSSQSVVNRYGFNSEGHLAVLERLRARIHAYLVNNALLLPPTTFPAPPISANPDPDPIQAILDDRTDAGVIDGLDVPRSLSKGKVLGINLGKNKLSAPEAVDDFVKGVKAFGPYADVLVVNVSSPNTPGLRSLQRREILQELLGQVVAARNGLTEEKKPVVLLKIAPDLSRQEIADISEAAKQTKVDGIIVSNTTISRPPSAGNDPALNEAGGLSGPPLKPLSLRTLQTLYALTSGSIPLIGCGGISTGADALDYARAGASFVQLYTALGYQGVGLPRAIKDELTEALRKENKTWSQVVGSGVDRASVQRLGADVNPVGKLGLEEEGSAVDKLKREIEDVLAGKVRKPIEEKLLPAELREEPELPNWRESPAVSRQSTAPSAIATGSPESGLIPQGYPQIILVETPSHFSNARPWTQKDVEEKIKDGKDFALNVEDKILGAADATKAVLKETLERSKIVGRDIAHDDFAHQIREGTEQAIANFKQIGREIKDDDDFARQVRDAAQQVLKQTRDNFEKVGRSIRDEGEFSKFTGEIVEETIQRSKKLGRDIRDEGHFGQALRDIVNETVERSKTLGKSIREEGDFSGTVRDIVNETISRTRKLGRDIKDEGDFTNALRDTTDTVIRETVERSRKVGRDIRDDGDFVSSLKEATNNVFHETFERSRSIGRDVRDEGHFSETLKEIFDETVQRTKQVGRSIRDDGHFVDAVRGVVQETERRTKELGRKIRDEGDFVDSVRSMTNRIIGDTIARSKKVGSQIKEDGDFLDTLRGSTDSIVDETISRSKALGRDIKDEGEFSRSLSEVIHDVTHEAMDRARQVGRSIRHEGDFADATKDTAEGVAADTARKTQQVAEDIKRDSFLEEVRDAFRGALKESAENFRQLGRDIRHDPMLERDGEARREAETIKAALKEGPTGEPQRNGGGLFNLFSTFGERGNVTSESKRLV